MPTIVTFIGWHNSGKTTLATQVVNELKNLGYRVAVIKSSSDEGVVFDNPGTDTAKHRSAGADSVMFLGPDQMVLQSSNKGLSLVTLAHRYFSDVDIVIGEGFKTARQVAKIEVLRNEDQMLRNQVRGVIAIATDLDGIAGDNVFHLDESRKIALFIEKRYLLEKAAGRDRSALFVNGKRIPLKNFVQEVLSGVVLGFVSSLKCSDQIDEIELRIRILKD